MVRDQLQDQEFIDIHLDGLAEESCQLHSQSQEDSSRMAAMSSQIQELIAALQTREETMGKDFEELNECFDCHRQMFKNLRDEDGCLVEEIIQANHKLKEYRKHAIRVEEERCRCGRTS